MADTLNVEGKIVAMTGIEGAIQGLLLCNAAGTTLTSASVTGTSFTVNGLGTLVNTSAVSMTITAGIVGETGTFVKYVDGSATPKTLMEVDLEVSVVLTTEGTATFAAGDLTADL